jgi:hypothetical protein
MHIPSNTLRACPRIHNESTPRIEKTQTFEPGGSRTRLTHSEQKKFGRKQPLVKTHQSAAEKTFGGALLEQQEIGWRENLGRFGTGLKHRRPGHDSATNTKSSV